MFQWGHAYSYGHNGNRTSGTITANGASMGFTNGMQPGTNRQSTAAGVTVTTNAAGDITSLLGKTLAYDSAGRLSEATAVPPCPSGSNCAGAQTTLSRFNGWGQRYLRETPTAQTVFSYGTDGHNLLSETTRNAGASAPSTTEHIWLPTASGPMPVAAVIDGVHYAVHADHLNMPRRLSDSAGQTRWQWPYSGFGEINPQSTPAAGQTPISYSLRYPGQIDDGNGLFYNWNRFYDPRVGRYTSSDPIALDGGWNRFGYVGANPLGLVDPTGEFGIPGAIAGGIIGGVSGGLGAAATGGSVWRGALFGAGTGVLVGGTGAWIGASLPGQMALRAGTAGISNLLGQMQGIGDPCFTGMNGGSVAGSIVGGALGGVLAPGAWGTSFAGSVGSQVGQRAIAGLPGAGVSGTVGLVGNRLGSADVKCGCK